MRKIKLSAILFCIFLLAGFLRFYQLDNNPPSLNWDEAAWGYNAYAIGIDGRDEFGRFLPHDYLESFGDFKPPLYAYLDVLPVKIFGLNEFAVRFPSAFLGTLTVLMTFFLTNILFKNKNIAFLAAFLLAISPWHIMLSRAAFEANVATFFIVSGVYAFLLGVERNKWFLILSAVSFVASIYTFNTARIVSPFLVLVLGIGFRNKLWQEKRTLVVTLFMGILLILPTVPFIVSPQAGLRFKEVNIFSDIEVIKRVNQEVANDNYAWWSKIIHHRYIAFGIEYTKHYLDHFNPEPLFIKGDKNPRFSTQDVGQMYLWELPFFIIGALVLFRKKEGYWWIVPVWLLLGIIPAATARETPHALRIETTLPTFQILVGYGLWFVLQKAIEVKRKRLLMQGLYVLFFLFLCSSIVYYYHGYFAHYPRIYSSEWQYGYREIVGYVKSVDKNYSKVFITEELGRPYVYFLFYTEYDPKKFRKEAIINRDAFGFVNVKSFGKYEFVKEINVIEKEKGNVLYLDAPQRVPKGARIIKHIFLLNGQTTLVAYEI